MKAALLLTLLCLLPGCDIPRDGNGGNPENAVSKSEGTRPARRDLSSGPKALPGKLPAEDTEIGWLVPSYRDEALYCGDIGYIDLGSDVDHPAYYFRREDGFVIGRCGGACMIDVPEGRCARECPPAEWICRSDAEPSLGASLAKPERPR